tara:strand:+ start:195 stop:335 length:141 start_codon:yes stop_codon:yes gene_type:complete
MKKIIAWFKWRGITLKDFVYMTTCIAFMITVAGIMVYAAIITMVGG